MSGTYEDLRVWQCVIELVVSVYNATKYFPKEEAYGLVNQMRRAAASVASNIAEGKGRASDRELRQFLSISRGSLFEVRTQIVVAQRLGYVDCADAKALLLQATDVGRMLNGLMKAFRAPCA